MANPIIKLMIIGDSGTGKTQLISRYIHQKTASTEQTNTISLYSAKVQIRENLNVKTHLIDNPGSPNFFNVIKSHWTNSHGALVVYDVCNLATFQSVRAWIQNYKTHCSMGDKSIVMICGNKCCKTNRQVSAEEGEKLALEYGCLFFETSALNNINVTNMFTTLITTAYDALPAAIKLSIGDVSSPPLVTPVEQKEFFHSADMLWKSPKANKIEDTPIKSSLWERTVDLLDWLIPESPSDDECSEEETIPELGERPIAPRSTSLHPAQRILTRKKAVKKEDEFSTESLVHFLTHQKPLQTMLDESAGLKRDSGAFLEQLDLGIEMVKIDQ